AYVTLGDRFSYWSFFPAADGWGRIPVWGFATVLESACDGIAAGERFFGYYPMSSHGVMEPTRVTPVGFADGIAHRRQLPPLYNRYIATTPPPAPHAPPTPRRPNPSKCCCARSSSPPSRWTTGSSTTRCSAPVWFSSRALRARPRRAWPSSSPSESGARGERSR